MMVVIIKEAQIDMDEIFEWYEAQKQNLGLKFLGEFDKVISKIVLNPYYAFCIEKDARSASLKIFPYEVIYRIDEEKKQIRIIAIIHQHRNPRWTLERLI